MLPNGGGWSRKSRTAFNLGFHNGFSHLIGIMLDVNYAIKLKQLKTIANSCRIYFINFGVGVYESDRDVDCRRFP